MSVATADCGSPSSRGSWINVGGRRRDDGRPTHPEGRSWMRPGVTDPRAPARGSSVSDRGTPRGGRRGRRFLGRQGLRIVPGSSATRAPDDARSILGGASPRGRFLTRHRRRGPWFELRGLAGRETRVWQSGRGAYRRSPGASTPCQILASLPFDPGRTERAAGALPQGPRAVTEPIQDRPRAWESGSRPSASPPGCPSSTPSCRPDSAAGRPGGRSGRPAGRRSCGRGRASRSSRP